MKDIFGTSLAHLCLVSKTAVLADKKLEVVTGLRPEAIDERLEEIKKQ